MKVWVVRHGRLLRAASRPVIRGLGGERVLVLEDGISALDVSSLSGDHAVSIESVLADQVEILKGPATLAGSDNLRMHVDGFKRETDDVEIPGFAFPAAERAEHLEEEPDEEFERDKLHNTDSESYCGAFGVSVGDEQGFIGLAWSRFDTNYGVPEGAHEHHDEGEEPAPGEEFESGPGSHLTTSMESSAQPAASYL